MTPTLLTAPPLALSTLSSSRFVRWFVACAGGELVGFGAAALWAAAAFSWFGGETAEARGGTLVLMVLAGVCEGAVLGVFQWRVLRRLFPGLPARRFVGATVTVAATGWLLGMLPSTLAPSSASNTAFTEPSLFVVAAGAVVFGAVIGAVFGAAQAWALRPYATRSRRFIVGNAAGWALGLPFSFIAGSLGDVSASVSTAALIAAAGGLLMGSSVAIGTGLALHHMQPRSAR